MLRAWLAVVQSYHLCSDLLGRRLDEAGIRTVEHEVLANLLREPGISQQTLARRCFTAKSQISTLVAELESRGWLRRDPDPLDARARRLSLTPEGTVQAQRGVAIQGEVLKLMAAAVSPQELAAMHISTQAINTALTGALAERG
jgi:DNA-binding MarR family transcriptional regulator